jgi:CHAT domain-containing protein/Flp pilus assembly protein TadD
MFGHRLNRFVTLLCSVTLIAVAPHRIARGGQQEGTRQDESRVAAEKIFLEAERLRAQGTAQSLPLAIKKYEEALASARAARDRRMEADALKGLGLTYNSLGERKKTLQYLRESLPLYEIVGDRRSVATTLLRLGSLYYSLNEKQEALDHFNKALPELQALGLREHEAEALTGLGIVYSSLGEKKKALEYYEQALPIYRTLGNRSGEAIALYVIGSFHDALGEKQQALTYLHQALPMFKAQGDREYEINTLYLLGVTYDTLEERQKAIDHFRQALTLRKNFSSPTGEAYTLRTLANLHESLGEKREAIAYDKRALALYQAAGNYEGVAALLRNMGVIYDSLGERQQARECYQQALPLFRLSGDRRLYARLLTNLSKILVETGEHQQALKHLEEALPITRNLGDRFFEVYTLYWLARIERERGNLTAARARIEDALGVIETLRTKIDMPELRASAFTRAQEYYEFTIDLLMQLHEQNPAAGFAASALESSERARTRVLLELLAEARIDLRHDLMPEQRDREDAFFSRISAIQKELWGKDLPQLREQKLRQELSAVENELEAFRAELRRTNPRYANLQYPEPLAALRIGKELLDQDTALIEYSLGGHQSLAWVVTQNKMTVFVLPPRKQIEERVAAYRQSLTEKVSALTLNQADARVETQSKQLYKSLFQPMESALSTSRRLIIVPDGVLAYLPFETLTSDQEAKKYMIERFAITYAPSASALAAIKMKGGENSWRKGLLAFGDPSYDRGGNGKPQSEDRGFDLKRLPYTRAEVMGIISLFPASDSQVYLGREACEQAVKTEKLDQYCYIHFAAHGHVDEDRPARSGIVLSLGGEQKEDGVLQMSEIMRLSMNADLVTLSACRTGLGKLLSGEGIIGLTRAFLYAGSSSVVVSLWNVNDSATSELMKAFYQNLQRGLAKDDALRQAKLLLIRGQQRTWRHPYFWAPFVLVGNRN